MNEQQIRAEIKDLSDYLEGDLGSVGHLAIDLIEGSYLHRWCETPRHAGRHIPSREYWVFTKYNYGDPLFLALCQDCHKAMYETAGYPLDSWRLTGESQ